MTSSFHSSNQNSTSFSFSADHGKNPKRRVKSRWEPLPEEKMATHTSTKEVLQDLRKGNKKVVKFCREISIFYIKIRKQPSYLSTSFPSMNLATC